MRLKLVSMTVRQTSDKMGGSVQYACDWKSATKNRDVRVKHRRSKLRNEEEISTRFSAGTNTLSRGSVFRFLFLRLFIGPSVKEEALQPQSR